jgi:hypothetical protein
MPEGPSVSSRPRPALGRPRPALQDSGRPRGRGGSLHSPASGRAICAARLARSPKGRPTRPGAGALGGTRSAAGSAAGGRRGGLVGTSHTGRSPRPHIGDSGERSSSRSSALMPPTDRLPYVTPPVGVAEAEAIKPNFAPAVQRRFPENARTSSRTKSLERAGLFQHASGTRRIFVAF